MRIRNARNAAPDMPDMIGERVDTDPDYGDVYAYVPLEGRNGTAPAALYLLHRTDEGHEGEWWYLPFTGFVAGDESGAWPGSWPSAPEC